MDISIRWNILGHVKTIFGIALLPGSLKLWEFQDLVSLVKQRIYLGSSDWGVPFSYKLRGVIQMILNSSPCRCQTSASDMYSSQSQLVHLSRSNATANFKDIKWLLDFLIPVEAIFKTENTLQSTIRHKESLWVHRNLIFIKIQPIFRAKWTNCDCGWLLRHVSSLSRQGRLYLYLNRLAT